MSMESVARQARQCISINKLEEKRVRADKQLPGRLISNDYAVLPEQELCKERLQVSTYFMMLYK